MKLAVLVTLSLLANTTLAQKVELTVDQIRSHSAFRVPSPAMEPTVRSGEFVFVDVHNFQASGIKPGQILAFKQPPDGAQLTIKRLIALPGSTVQFRRWKLFVDNKEVLEPYVNPDNVMNTDSFEWGPITVRPGCAFVLSDNRDIGNDSRKYGCVPMAAIVGVVRFVSPPETPQSARRVP